MKEPARLLDSGRPRLRALVEAGKHDAPGEPTEAAVLCALGLAATGVAIGTGTIGPSVLARSLAVLRHVAFSKIGMGVLVTTVAASAGYLIGSAPEGANQRVVTTVRAAPVAPSVRGAPLPPAPIAPSAPAGEGLGSLPAPPPASALARSVPTVTSIPSARNTPLPQAPLARAPRSVVAVDSSARARPATGVDPVGTEPTAERPPKTVDPSMPAQLESIRRARAFVRQGDGGAALAELDAYEVRNPHGMFEEEDIALRVQSLRLLGDTAGAVRKLAELQMRFPGSVHLATLAR